MVVVGSGPTGIAAAHELAKRGRRVILLDVGKKLDSALAQKVSKVAEKDPADWSDKDRTLIRGPAVVTTKGLDKKTLFGSLISYADEEAELPLSRFNAELLSSYAAGGFSTVWGAACLPYAQRDLGEWPVSAAELNAHIDSVSEFMGLTACRDDLEHLFPLPAKLHPIAPSRQARAVHERLIKRKIQGLTHGYSRLAVGVECTKCGFCLYGCAYGQIYCAGSTIAILRDRMGVDYRPDVEVKRVYETDGHVRVDAISQGKAIQLSAERVFLAAGVLSSARIMAASLGTENLVLPVLDSQYFLVPVVRYARTIGATRERLHALAQLFLEIDDPVLSENLVHLQLYTYNDMFARALQAKVPFGAHLPLAPLLERLVLIQGYLHSRHSHPLRLSVSNARVTLQGRESSEARSKIKEVAKRMRMIGIPGSPIVTAPGRGFHSGGTFPMRANPGALESDRLGRVSGFERVHLVDASVFPTIPATTITYSAMLNATRIAAEVCEDKVVTRTPRTVAITGAHGYVGGILSSHFRKAGYQVVPLVRNPLGPERYFSLSDSNGPIDLSGVDFLVHAAYDFFPKDLEESRHVNVEGSRRLLEAARISGVKKLVLISTLSAFEGAISVYGRTKLEIEKLFASEGAGVVRPGLVYGVGSGGMMASLSAAASRPAIPIVNLGGQVQYTCHGEDLARLVGELIQSNVMPKESIVAASPVPHTMRSLMKQLANGAPRLFIPVPSVALYGALRAAEACGFKSRLRSDSLVSLLNQPPHVDLPKPEETGVRFRPFTR